MRILEQIIDKVSLLLGIIGGIIIVIGAIVAVYHLFQLAKAKGHEKKFISLDTIRQEIGRYIILGLEFFIGRDIIQSIFVPNWNEIGMLFVLIVMRTILSYFFYKEIYQIEKK